MTANDIIERNAKCVRDLLNAGAEIERLNAEVAKLRLVIVHEADCTEAADDEAMRRGHEIERLRAALQRIVDEADSDDGLTAWDGGDIAREALNK